MVRLKENIKKSLKKGKKEQKALYSKTFTSSPIVFDSAAIMSFGTFISRILGFLRDVLLAYFFPRGVTDSFVIAFRLPNLLRRIFGEGSIASGFIPIFLDQFKRKRSEAMKLAGGVWTFLLLFTAILTLFGVIWMEEFLSWILPGKSFLNVPEKFERTVFLARIIFIYFFFVTQFAFFMSMLNALGRFFIPALAPAFFNFIMILFILVPSNLSPLPMPGFLLAVGVLIGGCVQALVVFLALYQKSYVPSLNLRAWRKRGVFQVLGRIFPTLISLGLLQMISLVNIYFASFLEEGTHSSIYWGDRILELPQSLIAISLGTALLPKLAMLWNSKKKEEMIQSLMENIKILLFLSLPSAIGIYFLAGPLVETLFMRGEFQGSDVTRTVTVLQFYSVLLLFMSLSKMINMAFYAIQRPWFPAFVSFVSLVFHFLFCSLFVKSYGLKGLVFSTTLSGLIHVVFLTLIYHYFVGHFDFKGIFRSLVRMIVPLNLMGLGLFFSTPFLYHFLSPIRGGKVFFLFLMIGLSAFFYFSLSALFKVPEVKFFLNMIKKLRWLNLNSKKR